MSPFAPLAKELEEVGGKPTALTAAIQPPIQGQRTGVARAQQRLADLWTAPRVLATATGRGHRAGAGASWQDRGAPHAAMNNTKKPPRPPKPPSKGPAGEAGERGESKVALSPNRRRRAASPGRSARMKAGGKSRKSPKGADCVTTVLALLLTVLFAVLVIIQGEEKCQLTLTWPSGGGKGGQGGSVGHKEGAAELAAGIRRAASQADPWTLVW
eukprot:jgi/Mesen1/3998/ME000211S03179